MNDIQLHNRNNDIIKNKLAKDLGYKLVRIWETDISEQELEKRISI